MTDPTASQIAQRDEHTRVILLVGQSISLGLFASLLLITANSLFLATFGSAALPYAYLTVAALGAVSFYALATVQRTWPLPRLALLIDLSLVAAALAGWLALTAGLVWASFLLVVAIPLSIQAGFVVLGGQVGRLFDVRKIKRLFPRVVFGFATGFMLGGLLSGPLLGWLGRTENLLLPAAAAGLLMTGFLLVTARRYSTDLTPIAQPSRQQKAKPLSKLLTRRYVLLIFSYQMVAALTSQLLDFILLDRSGARFATSEELARFFGAYNIALNLTDMLFLALLAGWILSRFGLGLGFLVNPATSAALLLVMVAAGALLGPASTAFFALIALTYLLNIVLTDGATRTSLNAAYQALPADERTAVQTGVEGIGVPVAIGFAGLILLIFQALNVTDILPVALVTLLFALLWSGGGWLVYRGYAGELLQTLRRRALGNEPFFLDDRSSLEVALSLLDSPEPARVRLGLDALENAQYPELGGRIATLVGHSDARVRLDALERVERLRITEARAAVVAAAQPAADAAVRAAALRAWCALDGSDATSAVSFALSDLDTTVRAGVVQGLLAYCGEAGRSAAASTLAGMIASPQPAERAAAAAALSGGTDGQSSDLLAGLLQDPHVQVRQAALRSAGGMHAPAITGLLAGNLADWRTRSAAMTALAASGIAILPQVETSLANPDQWADGTSQRLLRAAAQIEANEVSALLIKHIEHRHPEVRTQVQEVLRACNYRASKQDTPAVDQALHNEAQHGQAVLQVRTSLGSRTEVVALQRALTDELSATRHRMMLLLSLLYDRHGMQRAEELVLSGQGATRSLAVETLEVMLSSEHRALLFALIDPTSDLPEIAPASLAGPLRALIESPAVAYPPAWARACGLYAAGKLRLVELRPQVEAAAEDPDPDVRATGAWAAAMLAEVGNR